MSFLEHIFSENLVKMIFRFRQKFHFVGQRARNLPKRPNLESVDQISANFSIFMCTDLLFQCLSEIIKAGERSEVWEKTFQKNTKMF